MVRTLFVAIVTFACLAGFAPGQDKPARKGKPDAIPGYKIRTVEGFTACDSPAMFA
jgi:hypothetical protein